MNIITILLMKKGRMTMRKRIGKNDKDDEEDDDD